MNWDDLRILLALVRSGSLTRASYTLGIDQSTVGRRLSALEAALGTTLFLRSKSGLIPTEVGEKLISDAVEMERRAERITQTAASPAKEPVGELRIMPNAPHWAKAAEAAAFKALGQEKEAELALDEALAARPDLNAAFLNRAYPFADQRDFKKLSEFMSASELAILLRLKKPACQGRSTPPSSGVKEWIEKAALRGEAAKSSSIL